MNIHSSVILRSTRKLRISESDEFCFYIATVSSKGIHIIEDDKFCFNQKSLKELGKQLCA